MIGLPGSPDRERLLQLAHQIGKDVVGPAAAAVDRDARFPTEAFTALRAHKLLSVYVPVALGGGGCTFADLSAICHALGQYCASTAMIYAMHQIQVACVVRHSTPYLDGYLKELCDKQLLLASATTEEGIGGDVRSSTCAVEQSGDAFRLRKRAPVISYGLETDDILVTARRNLEATTSDQVLVLVRKESTRLEKINDWDTLGMRGTCSLGFAVEAAGTTDQILPAPYAEISQQTMHPVSHLLWSSLWLGIATDALNVARAYVRAAARKSPGSPPPSALRLAELGVAHNQMRATVAGGVTEYESKLHDRDSLSAPSFTLRMNNVKIDASETVTDLVTQALRICGISGYKADSKFPLGRHLRDAHGAALMINNDRVLHNNAQLHLMAREDT